MGIGGQGISAVAQMAKLEGLSVSGCDQQQSATTHALEQAGIAVQSGHSIDHLSGVDMLVISPAVPALNSNNPELLAARERGMRVVTWQELLGELMRGKCVLSVSGVHGKGTTTSMIALMLVDAGLDPTCEIGAVVPRFGANYRLGKSDYFVNEADEFNHNFWHYHPRLVIVTSIEFEHPEFFADYEAFLNAFEHFIRGMDMAGNWPLPPTLILNADSPGCLELRARLHDWPGHVIMYTVGTGCIPSTDDVTNDVEMLSKGQAKAIFEAYDMKLEGQTSFRVRVNSIPLGDREIHLQLPGVHNIQNALAALTAGHLVGVDFGTIVKTLESFGGIRRRFEIRHQGSLQLNGHSADVVIVDDYAHHPTAIAATLEAARRRYPTHRLVAVYQPHMYSRTKTFFEQFLHAFDAADVAIITDIFPARERDAGLIHAQDLVAAMSRHRVGVGLAPALYSGSTQDTVHVLRNLLRSGDLVFIMGAGDIYTVTEQLLRAVEPGRGQARGQGQALPLQLPFDVEKAYAELRFRFGASTRRNEPLARHCTFGVGGPADIWVSLESREDLIALVTLCAERRWPLLLVGNGTNVLYADAGVRGIVGRLALNNYSIEDQGNGMARLIAGAGVSWPRLLNDLATSGWGGLEFGPGIPGTLGGAVISNAGAHNSELGQVLEWVEVLDARACEERPVAPVVQCYPNDALDLRYRHSRFRAERRIQFDELGYPIAAPRQLIEPPEIVMLLGISLHRADPQQLRMTIEDHKQHRKRTQPPQQSAGSVFKNPPGDFAGRLIEAAGMKGQRYGGAQISQRHANFIVNVGGASAADVATLIMEAHNRVLAQFGIALELEVELRGDWGTRWEERES
jgi:UDP-N-acetylmuramate--alanine ligase